MNLTKFILFGMTETDFAAFILNNYFVKSGVPYELRRLC